jgi:carboxypeptidase Q
MKIEAFRRDSCRRGDEFARNPRGFLRRPLLRRALEVVALVSCAWASALSTPAQIPQPKPRPLSPTVPAGSGACAVGKPCSEVAPQIIESALGSSPLEENLRYLADSIGGRVTGSPAAARAVGWAVERFRGSGVDTVHIEKFSIPAGWSAGPAGVEILAPEPFPVRLASCGWTPPTPAGGITAQIVDVGAGDESGFSAATEAVKGSIVLVHSKRLVTWEDLFDEYTAGKAVVDRAVKSGAAAIFWMSSRPNRLLYRHTLSVNGELAPLPEAIIAREDAERIARFLAAGQKVEAHFEMADRISGPIESENVVAEIRGYEKPDEFVVLGAHLDSWDLGTGALDNGCNAALVIDAARVIRSSGSLPRRSIRFILFTGEEQGLLGSAAYARAHRPELDRMLAAVIFDSGIGRVTGYSLGGRRDTLAAVKEALGPAASLGVKDFTLDAEMGTDNFDFLLEGVPTLVANQEPANYMLNYHAESDTFDKVEVPPLKRHVAIAAITAYALADAKDRIGPRQSRAEIESLIKETGLDREMSLAGFLPLWQSGARGRNPQP